MRDRKRQLRTLAPAALHAVRGAGATLAAASPSDDPAASRHEQHIEVMSISFSPVRLD